MTKQYMERIAFLLLTLTFSAVLEAEDRPVETAPVVDLARYSGKWFEIGRLANRFQRDCVGATAEYNLRPGGGVDVLNTCYLEDGSTRSIRGEAEPRDGSSNAKLRVRFNGFWFKLFSWLIKADYWVMELADDYSYAVVGTPNRDYLWILARERTMDDPTYHSLVARIRNQGFEVDRLVRTAVPETTHE